MQTPEANAWDQMIHMHTRRFLFIASATAALCAFVPCIAADLGTQFETEFVESRDQVGEYLWLAFDSAQAPHIASCHLGAK